MVLDNTDPEKKLGEFERSADRATDAAADGMQEVGRSSEGAAKGVDSMKSSVGGTNREIANLIKSQIGLSAFRNLASTIGNEWRKVADDIGKASREWQQFRASLQGVASLEGKPNSNQFAAGEVDRAERAHVTPAEMKDFREAFMAKASLYVGEGPDAKLSTKDADEFQEYLSEYAKLKGVSQQEMAGFAGSLLAQQKGKTTAAEMKKQAGQVFATLEASSAPVSHLLPMMTRAQAQGFSAQEASQTLAMMPEIAPEEEGTYLIRTASALRERVQKGEGDEFGLKKGMTPYQMLTATVKSIKDRAAKGEDVEDMIARATNGEEVSGRTLRGMVNQGPEAFDKWRRVMEKVPDDQLERTIREGRASDAGRQYAVDSRLAVEQARMGMRNDSVERRRQIAEAELTASGRFEHLEKGQVPASLIPWADDMRTRQINLQAIQRARAELGESSGMGDAAASLNKGSTDELLRTLIRRIEEQNAMMKDDRKGNQVPAPMPAKPPNQPVRAN